MPKFFLCGPPTPSGGVWHSGFPEVQERKCCSEISSNLTAHYRQVHQGTASHPVLARASRPVDALRGQFVDSLRRENPRARVNFYSAVIPFPQRTKTRQCRKKFALYFQSLLSNCCFLFLQQRSVRIVSYSESDLDKLRVCERGKQRATTDKNHKFNRFWRDHYECDRKRQLFCDQRHHSTVESEHRSERHIDRKLCSEGCGYAKRKDRSAGQRFHHRSRRYALCEWRSEWEWAFDFGRAYQCESWKRSCGQQQFANFYGHEPRH